MTTGKDGEFQIAKLDLGPAPCNHCGTIHKPYEKTCGDRREPVRRFLFGPYGAITLNPQWIENQSIRRYEA